MAVDLGNLTTVVFGGGFAMVVTSVDSFTRTRAVVENSNMGTTLDKTFIPDDLEESTLSVTGHFDGTLSPPIDAAAATVTVDWAGGGVGSKYSGSGIMTNFTAGASMGEMMTGSYDIQFSGTMTGI